MTVLRRVAFGMLFAAVCAGTTSDRSARREPLFLGGYRVLAVDFHLHSSTWSDGTLTPWGLVMEADRQNLDAIAITGHNQVSDAKVARWFAESFGGPIVLVGQEVVAPGHHLIAVGVERAVNSRQEVARQAIDIHQQGGVAIAAHPVARFWPGFDAAAMAGLDGAEICHPLVYFNEPGLEDLQQFAAGGRLAAIGSSDFHGFGRIGLCRTYVFSTDSTPAAIIDAVRARRTVVYVEKGRAYGDPSLVQLAAAHPELRAQAVEDRQPTALELFSRLAGLAGLAGLVLTQGRWTID
jgi:hypothetical protein